MCNDFCSISHIRMGEVEINIIRYSVVSCYLEDKFNFSLEDRVFVTINFIENVCYRYRCF